MRSLCRLGLAVSAGALALGVACSSGDSDARDAVCKSEAALTYDNFAGPFLLDWCTGCHSSVLSEGERQEAPVQINFDTLEDIRKHQPRIMERAVHLQNMPPVGGPTAEERRLLGEWLECGAPVGTRVFSPEPPPPETALPVPTGACAAEVTFLEAVAIPRCSSSTWQCVVDCTSIVSEDEDAVSECQDACVAADESPATKHEGVELDCEGCTFRQMSACAWQEGCAEQVALLMCCLEDCYSRVDPDACFASECGGAITAYSYCIGFDSPVCIDHESGPTGQCFDKAARTAQRVVGDVDDSRFRVEQVQSLVHGFLGR